MIFTGLLYPLFLLIATAIFHFLPQKARPFWITLCGIAFYGFYAGGFLLLILAEAVMVYVIARYSSKHTSLFIVGTTAVVGFLGYYKYRALIFNLLTGSFTHFKPISAEHLIIPLALSFYTFEFIHYLVDMRRGTIEKHGFLEFMAFAAFFPTMVAGPIKRFQDFSPKLRSATLSWGLISTGLFRIATGAAKKIIIADSMDPWVAQTTTAHGHVTASVLAISLLAYSVKIYMDFSGYSDIAIGSAALFGVSVPENFSFPYIKTNIAAFWKSWHISLTRWIIDYIFIPLGGSKKGITLACINTLVALAISGLWHGAAWNFVVWGLYQGLLLAAYRLYRTYLKPSINIPNSVTPATRIAGALLTFALVSFGWGFFIMPVQKYLHILANLFTGGSA